MASKPITVPPTSEPDPIIEELMELLKPIGW